ncbi:MAG: flagellar motor switch protein FliG [Opitutaceae bacterium]|nr:flagellar motor switch protein FliG [Opitutaceae bacterium]
MTEFDYGKLTRQQKLAVFLILAGPETAAEVLRQFDDAEIELICREMSAFKVVPAEIQRLAVEEFSGLIMRSASSALGGIAYAQRTLAIAKGDQKASAIVGRIGPGSANAGDVAKDISEMDAMQIFNLVKHEQPQTVAFLLSYLDSAKAAEVFSLLNLEVRDEIVERLGTIESTSLNLANKIARGLGKHHDAKARPSFHRSGGVRAVADLLNLVSKESSKAILTKLEERNASLCAAVRKKLFGFEDINRLTPADLQRILREVDSANLTMALKGASETLRNRIYTCMSKRAVETLKDEMEMLGTPRRKEIDAAQDAVIQIVRRLEEEGQISLDPEPAETASA